MLPLQKLFLTGKEHDEVIIFIYSDWFSLTVTPNLGPAVEDFESEIYGNFAMSTMFFETKYSF